MTKASELKFLDDMITRLGADSYLGPWLIENKAEIEASIRADIEPMLQTPRGAQAEAKRILQDANVAAAIVKSDAAVKAHDMLEAARHDVEMLKQRTRDQLAKLAKELR